MADWSVQLNRIGVGDQQLHFQRIQPQHRKTVESTLSTHLLNQEPVNSYFKGLGEKPEFDFDITRKGPIVHVKGQERLLFPIEPESQKELRKIERVVRFYQHTGTLPRKPRNALEAVRRKKIARVAVKSMQQAAIPGAKGKLLAVTNLSENSLSLARDVMRSMPQFGPNSALVHNLGYPAGVIWAFFSGREVKGGWADYKRAQMIDDGEGIRRAKARLVGGGLALGGSAFFLAGKAAGSAGAAAAATALSLTADACFGVGSVIAIGMASLGIHRCRDFRKRLDDYYMNPLLTEDQKVEGTLHFFKELVTVTPEEHKEIIEKIEEEHPQMSFKEKDQLLEQKLNELTETKIKYLKRRSSNKSLGLIIDKINPILAKLKTEATKAEGTKEAHELIKAVRKDNVIKEVLFWVGIVAAVISIIGLAFATFASFGAAPFILMGLASGIYLIITGYTLLVGLLRKDPSEGVPGINLQPLDAGHI